MQRIDNKRSDQNIAVQKNTRGQWAEQAAGNYLEARGLTTVASNVRYRFGEIDRVMRDKNTLVFVEVRYRAGSVFGDGLLSVSQSKKRRIALAAQQYLAANAALQKLSCRFDAIAVSGEENSPQFDWCKNAFDLDDV